MGLLLGRALVARGKYHGVRSGINFRLAPTPRLDLPPPRG
jgi:hypothetical protein